MINSIPVDCRTNSILGILNNSVYKNFLASVCYMDIFLDFNREKRSVRIEQSNPVFSLAKFGFEIESRTYQQKDLSEAYEDIIKSSGIVIQHSYSTLLRRMRMIKVNLPVDIPHMVYSQQMRKVDDNLIFNTTDLKFRVMSWQHFFLNEDDEVIIYLIRKKPDKVYDNKVLISSAKDAMEVYLSTVNSKLIADIISDMHQDIIADKKYESAAIWNRNVWKLYITRGWYHQCLQNLFPACSKNESVSLLSAGYKSISDSIVENVINNKNYSLNDYIQLFGEHLDNEHKTIAEIYEQI
ncbi:hypothetical protein [Erwinia mallotivora]|uniref:Uncharacterized protein n=1 Tax=Erwinia mallotivora TaxID=69222 RepID=A0A014NR47_9GAMM|nr:hypothetical protein [Erwinia mallotivora]EXU76300.1 hypothetical protein BG55_06300 [Erwinia mallotivora]